MTKQQCTGGQGRVVWTRRGSVTGRPSEIDRRLLGVLCTHRVVTQEQLARLFPEVPERTLRYRTRRLHDLGLAGRSRPCRERGSAPNHHWPTRRADCLMRGDPMPRGGERHRPNPIFLAHAAALTEFYVMLATQADTVGLTLELYRREGEAREAFTHSTQERALAPDAMVVLVDGEGRQFGAFVEIDLGTMSHTRLRQKAELYAAYAESDAWHGRHLFLPALLFLTTSDIRAVRFSKALASALSNGRRRPGRRAFVAGAAGTAWAPGRLLGEPCLADLDGNTCLALIDILAAARAPYEQARAHQRQRREVEDQQRRALREDPEAIREHLRRYAHALASYRQTLDAPGGCAIELLTASTGPFSPDERGALRAIARDLGDALLEPRAGALPPPGAAVRGEVELLISHYHARQAEQINTLAARHSDGPSLRRAARLLRQGMLLDPVAFAQLPYDAERDTTGRREQQERATEYRRSREHAARQLVKRAGPLGRLTHHPEDFYAQLDHERLRVCTRCEEAIYPPAPKTGSYGRQAPPTCHYCHRSEHTRPYNTAPAASKESEAHQ
ncbi:MAG TPA: replication-relaxation family protein [Solirubrobacteraceae bacterium]